MTDARQVLTTGSVQSYFQDVLADAMDRQRMEARDETIVYLVNLLAEFTRTERLYDWTPDGYTLRPLAMLYGDAVDASGTGQRNQALRRLGDIALFIAGIFSDSLARSPVDVDYYVAMGGTAYGCLSENLRESRRDHAHSAVFGDLADRFQDFVAVLSEVGDHAVPDRDSDIVRLYEQWTRTRSPRIERKLRALGVQQLMVHGKSIRH